MYEVCTHWSVRRGGYWVPMLASWLELRDFSSPNVIVGLLRIFLASLASSGVRFSLRLKQKKKKSAR
jgi:hypothetical protein